MEFISIAATIANVLTYIVDSSKETGSAFFTKVGEEIFTQVKSVFTSPKEKEVVEKIEKGETDPQLLTVFQAFLESKLATDSMLMQNMMALIDANKDLVEKAQNSVINDYTINSTGSDNEIVSNVQGSVTISKDLVKHYHFHGIKMEEVEAFDVKVNLSKIGEIGDTKIEREIENKLFSISVLIKQKLFAEALKMAEEVIRLHSRIADAWEYRALLSYLIPKKNTIIDESARNIIIYLNAASTLRNGGGNQISEVTYAKEISERYSTTLEYKIEGAINSNRSETMKTLTLFKLVNEYKTCYEIYPDIQFLKTFIEFLLGGEGIIWLYKEEIESGNEKIYEIIYNGNKLRLIDKSPSTKSIKRMVDSAASRIRESEPNYKLPDVFFQSPKHNRVFTPESYFTFLTEKDTELGLQKIELINKLKRGEDDAKIAERRLIEEENKSLLEWLFGGSSADYYRSELVRIRATVDDIKKQIKAIESQMSKIVN